MEKEIELMKNKTLKLKNFEEIGTYLWIRNFSMEEAKGLVADIIRLWEKVRKQ